MCEFIRRFGSANKFDRHGSEPDSTLVVEAALQAVVSRHVKLAKHIGAKPKFQPLPMVA